MWRDGEGGSVLSIRLYEQRGREMREPSRDFQVQYFKSRKRGSLVVVLTDDSLVIYEVRYYTV